MARRYFEDGSYDFACPPIQSLLSIMAEGHWQGRDASSPEVRHLFTRDYLLASEWYRERLEIKQQRDLTLFSRHLVSLEKYLSETHHADAAVALELEEKLQFVRGQLHRISAEGFLDKLVGTLGADPLYR